MDGSYISFIILADAHFSHDLLATLSSIFCSRAALELENLALGHQIGVHQRSAAKRPKLTSGDLSFAIILCACDFNYIRRCDSQPIALGLPTNPWWIVAD